MVRNESYVAATLARDARASKLPYVQMEIRWQETIGKIR
jgi:hypothetical protein